QAEDGIRDYKVTGVQTCALPIFRSRRPEKPVRPVSFLEPAPRRRELPVRRRHRPVPCLFGSPRLAGPGVACRRRNGRTAGLTHEIGRASCRERVERWEGGGSL